jgi:hypothetical protein
MSLYVSSVSGARQHGLTQTGREEEPDMIESMHIYNQSGTYIMDIDGNAVAGMNEDDATDYAFAVARRSGLIAGSFGVEIRHDTLASCPFGGTRKDRAHGECPASCPCYCDGE